MTTLSIVVLIATVALFAAAMALVRRDYSTDSLLRPVTVVIVWAAYVVHALVTGYFAILAPLGRLPLPSGPAYVIGGALVGVGVWLAFESIATFASLARMSGRDTSHLVTNGIYAFSRNPQNLGWWLVLVGVALIGRAPTAFGLAAVFAIVIHTYIVWLEEPYLGRLYGGEYRDYLASSPRYIGLPEPTPAQLEA